MNVRAKFRLSNINIQEGASHVDYNFTAVCADEVPENQRYHKYTPSGNLHIAVNNPDVKFELGKEYYLDFTPAS